MRLARSAAWGAALTLALGCGSEPEAPPAARPDPAEAAPPPAARPAPAPEGAGAGDAVAGAELYATYCSSCHGPRGEGDGPLAASLEPKPANHRDAAYMRSLSDAHLFQVVKEGGAAVGKSPLMAPWGGTLSDEQIRDVVAYVRTLAGS